MNRSLLLVVLLLLFPSDHFRAQTGTSKSAPATNTSKHTDAKASSGFDETNPEAKSLYDDGIARLDMGQVSEAVERFQKALKLDPEYVPAYSALGRAFFKLKQWENATETFRHAIALKAKKRESLDKPQQNQLRRTEPDAPPTIPASKPKGTVSSADHLNKPLPALTIDATVAVANLGSALKPPQLLNTAAGARANMKFDDQFGSPPPELRGHIETVQPPAPTASPVAPTTIQSTPAETNTQVAMNTPLPSPDEFKTVSAASPSLASIENPKAFAGVVEDASHSLVVDGLVKNPGTKLLKNEATLLAVVVAEAQPLPEAARVTVVRNGNRILEADLTSTADARFPVQPGDVVTLQPQINESFYVEGKVKSPGEKTYRFGLTLTQAIIMAGGTASSVAEIIRDSDGGVPTKFDLKAIQAGKAADPAIKPRDRIILH
jgi:protein involved in polysaccharide export with SLBB domain